MKTSYQTAVLTECFKVSPYISKHGVQRLSKEIGLSEKSIRRWFVNERYAQRKIMKAERGNTIRTYYFQYIFDACIKEFCSLATTNNNNDNKIMLFLIMIIIASIYSYNY